MVRERSMSISLEGCFTQMFLTQQSYLDTHCKFCDLQMGAARLAGKVKTRSSKRSNLACQEGVNLQGKETQQLANL